MLNVRKLKQDYSQSVLREGKALFEEGKVLAAKIVSIDANALRISAKIEGQFENAYESEIEIDRQECETIDSDCDCPYHYDCQHLAALLFYLEAHLDEILVNYSKEADLQDVTSHESFDEEQKEELFEALKEAVTKQEQRQDEQFQKELMQEYIAASKSLSVSPFFLPTEEKQVDTADLAVVFTLPAIQAQVRPIVELQLALRLRSRSKPLHIPSARDFIDALRHEEPLFIGGKRYLFSLDSFKDGQKEIARMLMDYARVHDRPTTEKSQRCAFIEMKSFGLILAQAYASAGPQSTSYAQDGDLPVLPCIYEESLEKPLKFSPSPALFKMSLEYIEPPAKKILINPMIALQNTIVQIEEGRLFECALPGILHQNVYYRFAAYVTRRHLLHLLDLRSMTIPEPLFGTFVENALPELAKFAEVSQGNVGNKFVTIPFVKEVRAICDISYLDGELETKISFDYDGFQIDAAPVHLRKEDLLSFVTPEGVLARNLVEEKNIIDDLFQGFIFDEESGQFVAKSEKKIVEFMTEVIPRNQERVAFHCPQNLLDQFIYDKTTFTLALRHSDRLDSYTIELKVEGDLQGASLDHLWECILARRAFLELNYHKSHGKRAEKTPKMCKILVLDLERMNPLVQLFDELGIQELSDATIERPLWSIANIDEEQFKGLPVAFSMSNKLREIRAQMLGELQMPFSPVPVSIQAELRPYQVEGVQWLERLRSMYLNGILADDMGLGKTLQAVVAVSQSHTSGKTSIVVCPTSLLYNWKEEIARFNPDMNILIIDGIPSQRKRLIESLGTYDILITSYSLLQKDIEHYRPVCFHYLILDEAQHIKNRGTRNAKSVKMLQGEYRVILSGTPIENSLEELWSLFDFLMPGFLSTFDRFMEKYIRTQGEEHTKNLEYLRKKVAPFIMRRMKSDVLKDLPPVSELVYHCPLSQVQLELYRSYAASARDELVKLVERDGFDKVQIHVLATLTRLKQICCHPAIFAKEESEEGDSAKYDMMNELLSTLIEGGHKTVIFSQYTKMLQIMKTDFEQTGIRFVYLDGTSKNRLEIVKKFNSDPTISVFLVSLKAGGTGLNLVGADTVIHYDMWWNPAVGDQATDRVYRLGQDKNVSVYKLVTLHTIEEKIVEMQKRKKGLVRKVVSSDEEALAKLTWEDVLALLEA